MEGRKSEAMATGIGVFDFASFFMILQAKKPFIEVLLENTSLETVSAALIDSGTIRTVVDHVFPFEQA